MVAHIALISSAALLWVAIAVSVLYYYGERAYIWSISILSGGLIFVALLLATARLH